MASVLMVDDSPEKLKLNYGNLVRVPEFTGDPSDTVLKSLSVYLETLKDVEDVRVIEKRGWLSKMQGTC